ncbi:invasion associated locus B family protein [Novispirillum sp. DQ9]|uniref:invasion associated locus B family protein n=1 Tax=Novispirillum sp. DQ9 TaxID=3398612 RepID=UPI003C7D9561
MILPRRMLRSLAAAAVAVVALAAAPTASRAADPQLIGTFGAWTAYTFQEGAGKVCYMAAQPRKAEGDYSSRGDIFALVTHRPAENSNNVISIVAGYPYKEGSEVALTVGRTAFTLFTHGDRAWARTSQIDTQISQAIRKGSDMVVKGTSQRGTVTTDTYSLSGSSQAYEAISKACNVKVQ